MVARAPDIIIPWLDDLFGPPEGLSNQPEPDLFGHQQVFNEIRADPGFQVNYVRVSLPLSEGEWFNFWGHNRHDWASLLTDALIVPVDRDH